MHLSGEINKITGQGLGSVNIRESYKTGLYFAIVNAGKLKQDSIEKLKNRINTSIKSHYDYGTVREYSIVGMSFDEEGNTRVFLDGCIGESERAKNAINYTELEEEIADSVAVELGCSVLPDIEKTEEGYRVTMPVELENLSRVFNYLERNLKRSKQEKIESGYRKFEMTEIGFKKHNSCGESDHTLEVHLKEVE